MAINITDLIEYLQNIAEDYPEAKLQVAYQPNHPICSPVTDYTYDEEANTVTLEGYGRENYYHNESEW